MANRLSGNNRPRRSASRVTTKSGRQLKVNRSLGEKWVARREAKAYRKAERLRGLPKSRLKRLAWRLNPKRQAAFWFSRDGGIMLLKIAGIAILVLFVLTLAVFAYFRKDLPNIKDISGSNLGGSISYYDRTGTVLLFEDYNAIKRVPVQSGDISNYLKDATIATEDRNFYSERGFDVRGIVRAAVNDIFHKGNLQGGSTIDQQLVKLTQNWTQQRSLTRKAKELILAVELERTYTKDEILTGYLNIAPYGGVDYGAQAAASDYFHENAKDLTLPQAAMLAAIPQSPSYYSKYSPDFDQNAFTDRYNYVLDSMQQTGKITKQQAEDAKKTDVLAQIQPQQSKYAGILAPYFVLAAKNELSQRFLPNDKNNGSANVGGWKVITSLDMNLQKQAEQIVADNLSNVQRRTAGLADEEATVLENVPTGQIEALVGGVDFNNADHGKINYADSSLIAPGSSFKPYDYVTLINNNNNVGAGSVLYDTQGPLPNYPCTTHFVTSANPGNCLRDYDGLQPGPITLRYALGGSRNIPAEKAMMEAVPNDHSTLYVDSINKTISTASAMMDNTYLQSINQKTYNCYKANIDINVATSSDQSQCYNASAIGDGAFLHLDDHVNGLATLAREGNAIPRTFITKITDASGKNIYQFKQPKPTQPVKQDAAYIVDNMASDPNASYLPGSCSATTCSKLSSGGYKFHRDNGWNIAIKTGTTNNGFDGLMTAWDTQFAVASWVGNHTRNIDISSRTGTAMEYLTEPITRPMIEMANATISKPTNWTQPSDIKTAPAFVVRNHIHYGDIEPSPSTDLFPSWYIGGKSTTSANTSQTIDKVSGKVATNCTPAAAKQNATNANAATWNIDIWKGGSQSVGSSTASNSNSSNPTDDVHSCSDSPPTISITATDNGNGTATLAAFVSAGTHPFNDPQYSQFPGTVTFSVNGQNVGSQPVNDPQDNVSMTYSIPSNGTYTVSATITDSVLYSATDSTTVNLISGATAGGPNALTAKISGPTTTISWSGGTAPFDVSDNLTGALTCSGSGCSVSALAAPIGSMVTVKDTNDKSASVAVTH